MKHYNNDLKNTKLFLLFTLLSSSELKKLEKFALSPYFNTRKEVVDLFHFLLKTIPKSSIVLTKAVLYHQIFPKTNYKDEKIRLLMSQLVQLIEEFLVIEAQNEDRIRKGNTLAAIYRKKGAEKPFLQTVRNTLNQQDKKPYRSANYYFNQYELYFESSSFNLTIRTKEQNLQKVSDTLDISFIIMKLRQVCAALSHQVVFQKDYDSGILPHLLGYIQEKDLFKIPAIALYYHYYLALIGEDININFKVLKELILKYYSHFPPEESRGLYIAGANVCIRIINNGNIDFLSELVDLYQKGLSSGALLEEGVLSRFTYQNIVSAGLRSGNYEWTRTFLKDYKSKVEKGYRESAYRFNLGRLAYSQKNYDEALELLRNTDHKDLLINLFSKTLLLKIYYELKAFKLLDSFLDAFQIYLRRKKDLGYHKENYQNIINYTQKMMRLNPYDKIAKRTLHTQIQAHEGLLEKKWLLEQLEQI